MGRNAQLIRQWAILKQIETTRWTTISDLADRHTVSTKTIRRDLAALMEAGFPLYDERYDGKVYWRLNEEYKGLPLANLSLSEIAALYFSKKLVINLAAPPFSSDIASAFKKIEGALPAKNIEFLDSFPYLDITATIADRAGVLFYEYRKKGITLDNEDILLSATALEEGLSLVTTNLKHFPSLRPLEKHSLSFQSRKGAREIKEVFILGS